MPPPRSGNNPDEKLRQEKLRPFSQPRSTLFGRDAPDKEGKPMLSRKPASDSLPSKASTDPPRSASSIPTIPPKVALSPPSFNQSSESLKPPPQPEKKSFWSWRPFRGAALPVPAVDTPQRFHVLYSLHVHRIQNLPSSLDGLRLIIHWNRQEEGLQTMPSRVLHGVAEFDETLRQRCTVFGSRNSTSLMRYDPKLFTLSVVALDVDELELGKHHVDLSRLLPEDDVRSDVNHSWSTSFELSGMAKGGSLFVTFNYDLLHQETSEEKDSRDEVTLGSALSTPSHRHEDSGGNNLSAGDKNVLKSSLEEESAVAKGAGLRNNSKDAWNIHPEEDNARFMNDLNSDLDEEVDLVAGEFLNMLDFGLSADSDGDPDSPRARLLRQFENEGLFGDELDFRPEPAGRSDYSERFPGRGFDARFGTDEFARSYESDDGLQLTSIMEAAESELQKATQSVRSKSRAQELEDEETQALMQRWGMNENAFRNSPSKPVFGPHFSRPPSLGKGLESVLYLEDGGSLRSMSPSHFPKNRATGSLVMQASKPVVVPSTMGSNAVDVLRHLASLGPEALAKQAMTAMPLQDIAGVDEIMAQQSSLHGRPSNPTSSGFVSERERLSHRGRKGGYDDYVSLDELAPLAMQNIETLAMDGLKIQADVADEEAPSYLDAAAWGILPETTKREKDSIQFNHDVAGMRFENLHVEGSVSSDAKESGPLSMALTIEEWSKLDAGILDNDEKTKERSLAIMAAHNADLQLTKGRSRKGGNMGNTLMIAMLVQLRDPLQNFEPVGAPMLTFIQAERVMLPPKPRMARNVSVTGNSEVDDELPEASSQKEEAPQFKLTGLHMSGLKASEDNVHSVKGLEAPKKGWGTQKHLQSGSRWLAAQGMSKGSKPSLLKGKAAPAPVQTKVKPGETLWSISARVNGSGHKWRELAALNPHIRNPDVIFANDSLRTR